MSFKFMVKLSVKNQRNPSRTRLGRKVSKRFPTLYQTKIYGWWSQKIQGDRDLPRNLISFHLRMSDIPLILEPVTFPIPTVTYHKYQVSTWKQSGGSGCSACFPLLCGDGQSVQQLLDELVTAFHLLLEASVRAEGVVANSLAQKCPQKNYSNWIVC